MPFWCPSPVLYLDVLFDACEVHAVAIPRERSCCGGQQDLVDAAQLRRADLAAEHPYLVAKDEDLYLAARIIAARSKSKHPAQDQVKE